MCNECDCQSPDRCPPPPEGRPRSKAGLLLIAVVVLAVIGVLLAKGILKSRTAAAPVRGEVKLGDDFAPSLNSGRPTLAEFGLGTCKVCQSMEPIMEEAAGKYRDKANIVFVSLDDFEDFGRLYDIRTMPTQIFFDKDGEEVTRHVGFMPIEEISEQLDSLGADK